MFSPFTIIYIIQNGIPYNFLLQMKQFVQKLQVKATVIPKNKRGFFKK